jgi:hypothetical protein
MGVQGFQAERLYKSRHDHIGDFRLQEKTEEEKRTDNIILFSVIGILVVGIVLAIVLMN